MQLQRCNFCLKVLTLEELGLKDKDIGILCKPCFTWLNEEFVPLIRGGSKCQ